MGLEFKNNLNLFCIFGLFSLTFHIWLLTLLWVYLDATITLQIIFITLDSNVGSMLSLRNIVQGIRGTCSEHNCHKKCGHTFYTNTMLCSLCPTWLFKFMFSSGIRCSRMKMLYYVIHGYVASILKNNKRKKGTQKKNQSIFFFFLVFLPSWRVKTSTFL